MYFLFTKPNAFHWLIDQIFRLTVKHGKGKSENSFWPEGYGIRLKAVFTFPFTTFYSAPEDLVNKPVKCIGFYEWKIHLLIVNKIVLVNNATFWKINRESYHSVIWSTISFLKKFLYISPLKWIDKNWFSFVLIYIYISENKGRLGEFIMDIFRTQQRQFFKGKTKRVKTKKLSLLCPKKYPLYIYTQAYVFLLFSKWFENDLLKDKTMVPIK